LLKPFSAELLGLAIRDGHARAVADGRVRPAHDLASAPPPVAAPDLASAPPPVAAPDLASAPPPVAAPTKVSVITDGSVVACAAPPLRSATDEVFATIGASAYAAIEELAAACADVAIVDVTPLAWEVDQVERLLTTLHAQARDLGLRMLVVGDGAVQVMMSASGTLAEVTCMPSVDLALAEA
jgi:hypothetical protein